MLINSLSNQVIESYKGTKKKEKKLMKDTK